MKLETSRLRLEALPEAGGNLTYLQAFAGGAWRDLLRPASPAAVAARDPQGMACFASIPYVSRIGNGAFTFQDKTYVVPPNQPPSIHPLHGYVWRNPGEIADSSGSHFTIRHDVGREDYPFHFQARQTWTLLGEDSLRVELSVENTGRRAMPFGLGLHPFFLKTPRCRLKAKVDKIVVNDAQVMPVSLDPLPPEHDFTDRFMRLSDLPVDNCFTGWEGSYALEWPEYGIGLSVAADPVFGFLVVCSPDDTDWFCVNPVTHYNDALNDPLGLGDTGLKTLEKGEKLRGSIHINLTKRFVRVYKPQWNGTAINIKRRAPWV